MGVLHLLKKLYTCFTWHALVADNYFDRLIADEFKGLVGALCREYPEVASEHGLERIEVCRLIVDIQYAVLVHFTRPWICVSDIR